MKLIDRDKFISDMFDFYIENRWNPRDIHFSLLDVRSNIDSPEFEVKAISISGLRRWLNKQDMPYKDYVIDVVEHAINAWEKENEID